MATGPAPQVQQQPSAIQLLTDALRDLPDTLSATSALGQLPKFSGKNQDFDDWIRELERHFLVFDCNDVKKKRIVFQTATGSVCEFLKRYLPDNQQLTYEQLKDELKLRYGEVIDTQHALKLLRSVKQKQGESIATYGERILSLAKDACAGIPAPGDTIQGMLVGQFTDGLLSDQVRIKLIRNNPATLTEAVNLALKEQNIMRRVTLRKGGNYDPHHESSYRTESRTDQRAEQFEPMQIDHARRSRHCMKCGRKGHFAKDCRVVRAVNHRDIRPKQPRQWQPSNDLPRCWRCNSTQHFIRDCPQPPVNLN